MDWQEWRKYLSRITVGNGRFHIKLINYVGPSPQLWVVFYNKVTGQVEVILKIGVRVYGSPPDRRGAHTYQSLGEEDASPPRGVPMSPQSLRDLKVSMGSPYKSSWGPKGQSCDQPGTCKACQAILFVCGEHDCPHTLCKTAAS